VKIGRLAPFYRWIEYCAFGRELERRRFAFLDRVARSKYILILGEGDGRVLSKLLTLAPHAHFDVVEISPEMIELARRRTGDSVRIRFICQDARTVELAPDKYDAVLTMFFLDCFSERDARRLIDSVAEALNPAGVWLHSEFAIPDGGWQRWHARIWIATMYLFFRAATGLKIRSLPPIGKLFSDTGLRPIAWEDARAGLIASEMYVFARNSRPKSNYSDRKAVR